MRFTLTELLNAGSTKWDINKVDIVIKRNLEDLCRKINALGYQPPMRATSCLRSIDSQKKKIRLQWALPTYTARLSILPTRTACLLIGCSQSKVSADW